MLSRDFKIKERYLITKVLKKGTSRPFSCFTAKVLFHPRARHDHFAVIASKKVAAKAVDRNTIRRRLYEAVRLSMEARPAATLSQPARACYDVIILAKQKTLTAPFTLIQSEITSFITHL